MAKKLVTVRLSDEAIAELKKRAEKEDRSEAYIIEKLLVPIAKPVKKPKGKGE